MKPITLHPLSVLAGLVLSGAIFVLAGAAQSHGTVQSIPIHDVRLVGEVPAEWWTYAEITTTQSFTVPAGHYFVVTASGGQSAFADGRNVGTQLAATYYGIGGITRVPFAPGTVLTTNVVGGTATLWGYLEPVR